MWTVTQEEKDMGRSVMTHPEAVDTAYRTLEPMHICPECENETTDFECCGIELDPYGEDARFEFEDLVYCVRDEFKRRFPSMRDEDRWAHGCGAMGELHCIVANDLCDVYISEYCGLVAISVVPTGESYYTEDTTGLARSWTENHAIKALDIFSDLRKMGTFSNGESVFQRRAAA